MYTDLIRIEFPLGTVLSPITLINPRAFAGNLVEIFVFIKNQHSEIIGVKPRVIVNGAFEVPFRVEYANIPPGETYYFTGYFTMPNENADIRAESYYYGVDEAWHFEDFQTRVIPLAEVDMKRLVINRDPTAGGYVTTSPDPESGTLYDSMYLKGTTVYVVAYPNVGYVFDRWSDEAVGITSAVNIEMTENRTVKAHFKTELEALETLEIDITPGAAGYVETVPVSEEGQSIWHNNYTGKFPYGTSVQVTAIPYSGYRFDHWSDEIVGGVSYDNPSYVQPMTEYRAAKAHFREILVPGQGQITAKYVVHGTGTFGTETAIPAAAVQTIEWIKLKVIGRNTSTQSTKLSLHYTITKPSGTSMDDEIQEAFSTPAGGEHTFIEPTITGFIVDELGEWTVLLELLDELGTVLDSYSGLLLTAIGEEPAPEPGAGITELLVIHGTGLLTGTEKVLPISGVQTGDWFKLKVTGVNPSSIALQMSLHYIITKPDGTVIEATEIEDWPYTGAGDSHTFIEPTVDAYSIDQVGNWTLLVELLGGDSVLDTWQGTMFVDVVEAPPGMGDILGMLPSLVILMMLPMLMGFIEDPKPYIIATGQAVGKGVKLIRG